MEHPQRRAEASCERQRHAVTAARVTRVREPAARGARAAWPLYCTCSTQVRYSSAAISQVVASGRGQFTPARQLSASDPAVLLDDGRAATTSQLAALPSAWRQPQHMLTVEPCPPAEGRQGQPSRVLLNPRDMAALGVSMGEPVLLCATTPLTALTARCRLGRAAAAARARKTHPADGRCRRHTSSTLDTHGIGSEAWQAFQQALAQHRPALAIGTAWPAAHASEHSALLSAMLRSNAGAALGDKIQVWPIEHAQRAGQLRVLPAASCTLAVRSTPAAGAARTAVPLPAGGTLRTYLRSRLQGQYVVPGNEIVVSLLGEKRVLCITALRSEVDPVSIGEEQAAVYLIGSGTDVEISEAVDTGAQPPKQAWAAALAPSTTKADSSPEPQAEPEPEPELALGQTRGVAGEGAYPPPAVGGLEAQLASVRELLGVALHTPDRMEQLGLRPPSGVLLYGPPGTGKTLIARSLAAECGDEVAFVSIDGAEIVGKYVGESEARLREVFEAAAHAPCRTDA